MKASYFFKHLLLTGVCLLAGDLYAVPHEVTLQNGYLSRTLTVENGVLTTKRIVNKITGSTLLPTACNEFSLRISQGTDKPGTAVTLKARDFKVTSFDSNTKPAVKTCTVKLYNKRHDLHVKLLYSLDEKDFYCHKQLCITPGNSITLEKVAVEEIAFNDAKQNYTIKQISPDKHGGWRPGLGQPVYTTATATFWGTEFPASENTVDKNGNITCGYLYGRELRGGKTYTSHRAVFGVADDSRYIDDAFYDYIDRIRIRPARLQIQYNSWFDYGNRVSKDKFIYSLRKVHEELVTRRGCKPLDAYAIDDGWQDKGANVTWQDTVWKINKKFTPKFKTAHEEARKAGSSLGLWFSPACLFGAASMPKRMKEYGFEALDQGMSMTGEKYMGRLEERLAEFTRDGITYFKFDGLFGHLNQRDFELGGRGTAAMPQLGIEGFSTHDPRLNDTKYDELKTYYLAAGTERLMKIFDRMHSTNPNVFISLNNGAYLSPWWLMHADIVWLINSSDAAKGKSRSKELAYRDNIYHGIWKKENTKFPMNSIFNHEPKKLRTDETPEDFRDYLYMNLSRGTGFIELYLKVDSLSGKDWDVLAEGLKWAQRMFPTFKKVRMHGGTPKAGDVYGYTAWDGRRGYISFHNPADREQTYRMTLNRDSGLSPGVRGAFRPTIVTGGKACKNLKGQYRYGDTIEVTLGPEEKMLLNFDMI